MIGLVPISWLYGFGVAVRNKAFDYGVLRVRRVDVPVISVGNLTAGGTGKTPLVKWIVNLLRESGKRVGVVSRGYGRTTKGLIVVSDGSKVLVDGERGGDEPVEIAQSNPGTIVVVGKNRVEAARTACGMGAEAIVMDDGFQHRYLHRDLNVMVWNAREHPQDARLLPAGRLREPISGARRADIIVLTHSDRDASDEEDSFLTEWLAKETVACRYRFEGMHPLHGPDKVIDSFSGKRILAVSGIGYPEGFRSVLQEVGVDLVKHIQFRDHYLYRTEDVKRIRKEAVEAGVVAIVTTEKDAIRLRAKVSDQSVDPPFFFVRIKTEFLYGETELRGRILSLWANRNT